MENDFLKKADVIRHELDEVSRDAIKCSSTDGFPQGVKDIEFARINLMDDTYDVVVCGEIKKGKSSFINAIMGENLLPVDTKVATSQAFRIVNSEEQRFYLVFTDGSKQEIGRDELENFGSQVKIDCNGEPITFNKIVDYLEIHTPIPFFPKSIVLVDTPGLGAIYANHATVTRRHLAKASAVVFIMDPANPLTKPEIDFLNEITDITTNILFVMTKQDNYDEEYIDGIIKRNTEILKAADIEKKLDGESIQIFPMSSTMLFDVANGELEEEDREIFYQMSSFDAVKSNLLKMTYLTIGLSKNILAYNSLNEYNTRVMSALASTENLLKSPNDAQKLLTAKEHVKSDFQSKWGPNGQNQKQILGKVNEAIASYSTQANSLFNPGTSIYNKLLQEIETLPKDYSEAKEYASLFPKRMMTEYMQAWQGLNENLIRTICEVMASYQKEMNNETYQLTIADTQQVDTLPPYQIPKYGWMDHFNMTKSGWYSMFFVASLFSLGTTLTLSALPLAVLIGWFSGKEAKIQRLKMDLTNYLNRNLSSLHNQILTEPMDKDNPLSVSLFEVTKTNHLNKAQETLKALYDENLKICEDEVKRLTDQITKINSERNALTLQAKTIREKWQPLHNRLIGIRSGLEEMEKTLRD